MAPAGDPCRDPCLPRRGSWDTEHVCPLVLDSVSPSATEVRTHLL